MRLKLIITLLLFVNIVYSQDDEALISQAGKWDFELRAGVTIGGMSPMPLPVEIREIIKYSPEFNAMMETQITKWLNNKFGVSTAIRLENKGMETSARVKAYKTQIVNDGNEIAGYWTGEVFTFTKISYLSVPILLNIQLFKRWRMQAGGYFSYNMTGKFDGKVSDGYLRENTPVGKKVEFRNEQYSSYDFSDDLRKLGYGIQLSGQWQAKNNLYAFMQFTYGISDIFYKNFETISFKMFPIYMAIGASYKF